MGLVLIDADGIVIVSTKDHPLWTDIGWVKAQDISSQMRIQTFSQKLVNPQRVINFAFLNPNNPPTIRREEARLIGVPAWCVPVISIGLQCYKLVRESKINAIAAYRKLLHKIQSPLLKGLTDALLQSILSPESAIASHIAKLPLTLWPYSQGLAALSTFDISGGAAAVLRTEPPILTPALCEFLAAPRTIDVLSIGNTAFPTANNIAIGDSHINSKEKSTNRANLFDKGNGAGRVITDAATIESILRTLRAYQFSPTDYASKIVVFYLGLVKTLYATILGSAVGAFEFFSAIVTSMSSHIPIISQVVAYSQGAVVYDLEVEGAHEFYANGILVHNCSICGPLDGEVILFDDKHKRMPPLHPNCRCAVAPSFQDDAIERELAGHRPTFTEWANARGITHSTYGQAYDLRGARPPRSPEN